MGTISSANKPIPSPSTPCGPINSITRQLSERDLTHLGKWNKLFRKNSHAIMKFRIELLDRPPYLPHQDITESVCQKARKTAQIIQNKTISSLHSVFLASSSSDMSFHISKLKNLHHLNSLTLDLSSVKSCSPSHLKSLSIILENFKKLTSLNINFPDSIEMTPRHFSSLRFAFHRLRSLTNLTLKFSHQQRPSFPSLKPLAKLLSKLTQLQSLTLSQFASVTPLALTFLPPVLKKLTFLESLDLDLANMGNFQSKHLNQVFLTLKDKKPFKNLAFNFQDCAVDFPNINPLSKGLAILDLSQLQIFKLNCYSNLTEKALEQLITVLQTSPLKLLDLDFSKDRFSSSSLYFPLNLQAFQSLSHLYLHPGDMKNGIQGVGIAIKPLMNLKSLDVNFSKQSKTSPENEFIKFSAYLNGLQNLKNLSLNLKGLDKITEKGVTAFSENLQRLAGLSSLNLELVEMKIQGVLSLFSAIKTLRKLTDLSLDFRGNREFSIKNLNNLAEAIQNLSLLHSTSLNFSDCESLIKKESFESLFKSLRKLKILKKITLHIPSSMQIQTAALSRIRYVEDQTIHWGRTQFI